MLRAAHRARTQTLAVSRRVLASVSEPKPAERAARLAAHDCIQTIYAALCDSQQTTRETFVPTMQDGVLNLDLGARGQYSLQAVDSRLLLFSPMSGPRYYTRSEDGDFANAEDGHLLVELLVRELNDTHGVCVFL